MKWSKYKLYKEVTTKNAIGQTITKWEYIDSIDVVSSNNLYTTVTNDVVYRKFSPSGITKHNAFEKEATYKISNLEHEYEIESFSEGRYTSLLLKEVI